MELVAGHPQKDILKLLLELVVVSLVQEST